jgi:hypothetical protein
MQINSNVEILTRHTSILINYTFCSTLHIHELETVCALANVLFCNYYSPRSLCRGEKHLVIRVDIQQLKQTASNRALLKL